MVIDSIEYGVGEMVGMLQGMPYPYMILKGGCCVDDILDEVAKAYLVAQGIEDLDPDLIFLDRERFELPGNVWQIELPKQKYGRFQLIAQDGYLKVHPMYGGSQKKHIEDILEIGSHLVKTNGITPVIGNPDYFAKKEDF
jgi:hypothetical protein